MHEQKLFDPTQQPTVGIDVPTGAQFHPVAEHATAFGEQAEAEPMLALTGSQLRMLSMTDLLIRDYENHIYRKSKPGQWMTRIVRNPDTVKAKLTAAITTNQTSVAEKIVGSLPTQDSGMKTLFLAELADPTSTIEDVIDTTYDKEFLQYYASHHEGRSEPPETRGWVTIPELGTRPLFDKNKNELVLAVRPYKGQRFNTLIKLPLNEQHLKWTPTEEIYGSTEEAARSQLEVFGELAKNADMVYTHITGEVNLPGYLRSESWGTSILRGAYAASRKLTGLMFEAGKLAKPEAYVEALQGGSLPTVKAGNAREPSFISSHYLSSGSTAPVILFDSRMTERRETTPCAGGQAVIGTSTFEDPSLIGIWVTPTYRQNLLDWISSWPQEEVDRIFKSRSPESILISTADQVPKFES